jgi:SAM-dependent methyltransferase
VSGKSLLTRLLYAARDLRSRALFAALRTHAGGDVLDVGGWDFYLTARRHGVECRSWTTLESDPTRLPAVDAPGFRAVHGDGCAMDFSDASFDTVLSIQVLEHVFEPLGMVREMARVLRPGGKLVLLVPQTSTTHLAPHYYGNFSRWWIERALASSALELVELRPLGGIWSSMASHQLYFFLQAARVEGMSDPRLRRSALFWLLLPLQIVWAAISLPVCLFLSLGDLHEEPNNHLVVARRPRATA